MTKAEMVTQLEQEVKGLTSYLDNPTDYNNACDDAARATGWAFPVSGDFKILWQKERAKRYLFWYLLTESAIKFQYKQIKLDQRFQHFKDIIESMDSAFAIAQEENAFEFAGVESYAQFGHKIDAGFATQPQTGVDITYDPDQVVIISPNDKS